MWAKEEKFFPVEAARRLAESMPDARLELVDDSYTFIPEDQPERLAQLIGEFVSRPGREGEASARRARESVGAAGRS